MFPNQPARPPMPQGGPAPSAAPISPSAPGAASPGGVQQVPAEFAQHIDPNNPLQMLLLQRIDRLTPQDGQALMQIPPAAVAVLKKVLPEVGFLLDQIRPQGAMQAGPGGMPPVAGSPPPSGLPPQSAPSGLPQPATRLGRM